MLRRLAYCAVVGAVLIACAACPSRSPDGPLGPCLQVENPVVDLGPIAVGIHPVATVLVASPYRSGRVLSLTSGCAEKCCFRPRDENPVLVPAGERVAYPWELNVMGTGAFEAHIALFLDDGGLRQVTLTVRGVGIDAGNNTDGQAPGP